MSLLRFVGSTETEIGEARLFNLSFADPDGRSVYIPSLPYGFLKDCLTHENGFM